MNPPMPFFQGCVQPEGQTFDAWPEHSLLDSMEQGGIAWPSSCRNGSCRTCIGQMRAGQVQYSVEWPGLSAEEQQEGWVLPCVAHPVADVVLQDPFSAAD